MQVRIGGEWKTISAAKAFIAGAWRTVVAGKIYASGAWQDVANFTPPGGSGGGGGTLTATASPNPCTGSAFSTTVVTEDCTVTPSGGLAPYSYAWSIVSGVASIAHPTSATTSFSRTVAPGAVRTATAQCLVIDSLGVDVTVTVPLSFESDIPDGGSS